ncbi:hypothetical protein TH53_19920 [Pedobacter lusitanus]|uniref:Uncharacterized protein n=1 Tax=Pedobacter lusitanus TaxID=1503925 RepID=A0A0D0F1V8_9SPHI|nr:hypothetical protein [Pedobacter lusitanus]KIO75608.1 hypothetical protein TH53_19920 [Pedobacter lusitanus]
MKNLSEIEKYYWELSEVYLGHYYDAVEPSLKIMLAMGVIVEMESDLVKFHKEKKETPNSRRQQERLKILINTLDAFTVSAERNKQFRLVMQKMYDQQAEKDKKN